MLIFLMLLHNLNLKISLNLENYHHHTDVFYHDKYDLIFVFYLSLGNSAIDGLLLQGILFITSRT